MNHRVVKYTTKWTPERDAQLVTLFQQGLRPGEIAPQMGASICAVEARYRAIKKQQAKGGQDATE
jgi:hypothetical protein